MYPALKLLLNNWWVFFGILVVILFFVSIPAGIISILLGIVFGIFVLFIRRRKKASLSRNLLGIEKITEKELAKLSGAYVEDAHAFLHDISRNPESSGISVLVKGGYIYYANKTIKEFKNLYKEGKGAKEILEELPIFETREEVKKVIEKLKEFEELPAREKKET